MLAGVIAEESLIPSAIVDSFIVREAANAADNVNAGFVFPTLLVDDPAAVSDVVDARVGVLITEAASTSDSPNSSIITTSAVNELVSANEAPDASITGVFGTWNPSDKSTNVGLSGSNLVVQATTSAVGGVRSTTSRITSGKYYFEVHVSSSSGIDNGCGIATAAASLTTGNAGTNRCNVSAFNGNIFYNGSNVGSVFAGGLSGKTVCFAIDFDNLRFWARADAGNWNNTSTANPATNTGGISISSVFASNAAFAFVSTNSTTPILTGNFGASTFAQSIPSGFSSWR